MTVLKRILVGHPEDRDTLSALISFARDAKDYDTALVYANQLAQVTPDDPNLKTLIEELTRQRGAK